MVLRLSSPPSIEGMDVSGLLSMMEAMGLLESVRNDFSEDPLSFIQKAMSFDPFSGTEVEEDEEKNVPSSLDSALSRLLKDFKHLKAWHEMERNLPPEKVAQVTKSDLSFLFNDSASDNSNSNVRETIIGTHPVHSTTALLDLVESASS